MQAGSSAARNGNDSGVVVAPAVSEDLGFDKRVRYLYVEQLTTGAFHAPIFSEFSKPWQPLLKRDGFASRDIKTGQRKGELYHRDSPVCLPCKSPSSPICSAPERRLNARTVANGSIDRLNYLCQSGIKAEGSMQSPKLTNGMGVLYTPADLASFKSYFLIGR